MKKLLQPLAILALLLPLLFTACKKQELKLYEDIDPALRLGLFTYSYSFIEDLDSTTKLIKIPVVLSGMMRDYDRIVKMEIVEDTSNTAEPNWIEIKEGKLPKNSLQGEIPIVLKRNAYLEKNMAKIKVRLLPGDGLSVRGWSQVDISWTSQIIKPSNWDSWLRYYFGTPFSTAYYKFIVEVTGRTSFPYHGTLNKTDPVTWWMGSGQVQAYGLQIKDALRKYNRELKTATGNMDTVFVHDDGPYKGLAVTLP